MNRGVFVRSEYEKADPHSCNGPTQEFTDSTLRLKLVCYMLYVDAQVPKKMFSEDIAFPKTLRSRFVIPSFRDHL